MKHGFYVCWFVTELIWNLNFGARSTWASTCTSHLFPQYEMIVSSACLCLVKLSGSKNGAGIHGKEPVMKSISPFSQMSYFPLGEEVYSFIFHYYRLWLLCPQRHFVSNRRSLWCWGNLGAGEGCVGAYCLSKSRKVHSQAVVLLGVSASWAVIACD